MKMFDMMTNEDLKRIKEDPNYQTLLEMWRDEKKKRQEAEDKIKELGGKCQEAGRAMIELNMKYEANKKELDRLSEENDNIRIMMKGADGKDTSNAG